MSVKRYEWVACDEHSCHCDVVESAEGDMVDYEDYAALEHKLAESQREFRAADATIENLQMQVEKLAAENAGLKSAGNKMLLSAISLMEDPELKIDHARDIKDWERIKTHGTGAFLAEVRAQGVEMFAAWNDKHIKKGVEHKESLTAVSHAARGFATQIRKGVQS